MTVPEPERSASRRVGVADVVSALPDLGLAGAFLITWIAPEALGGGMVGYLLLVMLLEFIIIHSSAFMGSVVMAAGDRRKKILSLLGFGAFYSLFVAGFCAGFSVWWPMGAFWGLTLNRLLGAVVGQVPRGEEQLLVRAGWAASACFYLLFVAVTVILPVPELGLTAAVARSQHLPGGGLWVDEPHRVLAFGFLYFTAVALSEIWRHAWFVSGLPAPNAEP